MFEKKEKKQLIDPKILKAEFVEKIETNDIAPSQKEKRKQEIKTWSKLKSAPEPEGEKKPEVKPKVEPKTALGKKVAEKVIKTEEKKPDFVDKVADAAQNVFENKSQPKD